MLYLTKIKQQLIETNENIKTLQSWFAPGQANTRFSDELLDLLGKLTPLLKFAKKRLATISSMQSTLTDADIDVLQEECQTLQEITTLLCEKIDDTSLEKEPNQVAKHVSECFNTLSEEDWESMKTCSLEEVKEKLIQKASQREPTQQPNQAVETIKTALETFLQDRWDRIKGTPAAYPQQPNTFISLFCAAIANLIDRKQCNTLLMPTVTMDEDIYGNEFNSLELDQLAILDDGKTFVCLADFFETAHPRVTHGDSNPFIVIDATEKPCPLKDTAPIAMLRPRAARYFELAKTIADADKGTVLDKLQALRAGLLAGDREHAQDVEAEFWQKVQDKEIIFPENTSQNDKDTALDHYKETHAGQAADLAIAEFYAWYVTIPESQRLQLRTLRSKSYPSEPLGSIIDFLFKPAEMAKKNGIVFCVQQLGQKLDAIIEDNINKLREMSSTVEIHELDELQKALTFELNHSTALSLLHAYKAKDMASAQLRLRISHDRHTLPPILANEPSSYEAITCLEKHIATQMIAEKEKSPLISAIRSGNSSTACALLTLDAVNNINARDEKTGDTALLWAIEKRDLKSITALLAHPDIDPNIASNANQTPAILAATYNEWDILCLLFKHPKTDVNNTSTVNEQKQTWLTWAIQIYSNNPNNFGYFNLFKTLLARADIQPNLPDKKSKTPLAYAVDAHNFAFIFALIDHPATDVNLPLNTEHETLLIWAVIEYIARYSTQYECTKNYFDLIKKLLARQDLQLHAQDALNKSVFEHISNSESIGIEDKKRLFFLLLSTHSPLDINKIPSAIESFAQHDALDKISVGQVRELLTHKNTDINVLSNNAWESLLLWAIAHADRDSVDLLLTRTSFKISRKTQAIFQAAAQTYPDIVPDILMKVRWVHSSNYRPNFLMTFLNDDVNLNALDNDTWENFLLWALTNTQDKIVNRLIQKETFSLLKTDNSVLTAATKKRSDIIPILLAKATEICDHDVQVTFPSHINLTSLPDFLSSASPFFGGKTKLLYNLLYWALLYNKTEVINALLNRPNFIFAGFVPIISYFISIETYMQTVKQIHVSIPHYMSALSTLFLHPNCDINISLDIHEENSIPLVTPFYWSICHSKTLAKRILDQHGAKVSINIKATPDKYGRTQTPNSLVPSFTYAACRYPTPLLLAASGYSKKGSEDLMLALLAHPEIDTSAVDGKTAQSLVTERLKKEEKPAPASIRILKYLTWFDAAEGKYTPLEKVNAIFNVESPSFKDFSSLFSKNIVIKIRDCLKTLDTNISPSEILGYLHSSIEMERGTLSANEDFKTLETIYRFLDQCLFKHAQTNECTETLAGAPTLQRSSNAEM